MDFGKMFSEFGFAGIVTGTLFFILWRMLIWVMKWVDKQSEQHNSERTIWLAVLANLNKSIETHNQGSVEARKSQETAHEYQRQEHIKLGDNLNSIGVSLKETEKALGRINGYADKNR